MSLDFYLGYRNDGHMCDVFEINITHNLTKMATAAGVYTALWHPEDLSTSDVLAKDLVTLLATGLSALKARPEYFSTYDAANGWGTYEHFVPFVQRCLDACNEYPNAIVRTST